MAKLLTRCPRGAQGVPLALPHHLGDPSPESLALTQHPGRMSRIDRNDTGEIMIMIMMMMMLVTVVDDCCY